MFQQKDTKSVKNDLEVKKFGILPSEWQLSKYNPLTLQKMKSHDSDSDDGNACCGTGSNHDDEDDDHQKGCLERMVFSEENFLYVIFNFLVSILNLVSSYFYIYLAAFRAHTTTI
jgi:hypothetical protein